MSNTHERSADNASLGRLFALALMAALVAVTVSLSTGTSNDISDSITNW